MSFLIFDVDHSLASIGGISATKELCSLKPIQITGGLSEVRDVISKLFRKQHTDYQHPLLADKIEHTCYKLSKTAEEYNLEGIVIDTISHLFLQDMRLLESKNKAERLDLQDWGKLERTYNQFISTLIQLPVWVVVNSHISYDKNDLGQFLFKPQLKGATRDFIGEYFDCILYTRIRNTNNKTYYAWQTRPDTQRYAKDRLDVLEQVMPQDFSILLSRYKEKGIANPKVLVIGESGTGKTRALLTAKYTTAKVTSSGDNDKASTEVISNLRRG
jgi:hypothetical protein